MRRWIVRAVAVVVLVAAPVALYWLADPEKQDLDDAVRRATPGQFVRLTDGYTHYEIAGPSTPVSSTSLRPGPHVVVLVAGFSVPYYIWDPTFKELTDAGFRVLRYDYYGRGFSDRPDIAYTDALYVRQLAELLDSLQIADSIDLVGLSLGGGVITSFADAFPARVRSLIYVDPSFRTPGSLPPFAGTPFLWNLIAALVAERGWADEQLGDFLHPERFPDWPDRYRVQLQYRGFRRARLSELVANTTVDQLEQIEQVGQHPRPVLVIWGKQDTSVPIESSGPLLDAMPRARLVEVEDSGHLPQWEQPAIVHNAIVEFLHQVK
ncbi:MAG TPA: alpha/beta fold hydrolase [Vicinamibacterales bacterium]